MAGPVHFRPAAVRVAPFLLVLAAMTLHAEPGAPAHVLPPMARAGSIEGRIVVPTRPQRVAERYAAGSPGAERPVQEVPPVVYLRGTGLAATAGPRTRQRLAQHDTTFVPAALAVPVGSAVEFPNEDPFFHNVFSYSKPKRFDLGRYPRGESKTVQFDEPGIVRIYCEVHKSMRALVVVVESPYHAVADANGRFALADVPPGRYELVVVTADRGDRTVAVEVRDGETSSVTVGF